MTYILLRKLILIFVQLIREPLTSDYMVKLLLQKDRQVQVLKTHLLNSYLPLSLRDFNYG